MTREELMQRATSGRPFSNGTEGRAWEAVWCQSCAHDHGMHGGGGDQPMCQILGEAMAGGDDWRWPEAWTPEPPGEFHLPSLMVCGVYEPCEPCGGDPQPEIRANVVKANRERWASCGGTPRARRKADAAPDELRAD